MEIHRTNATKEAVKSSLVDVIARIVLVVEFWQDLFFGVWAAVYLSADSLRDVLMVNITKCEREMNKSDLKLKDLLIYDEIKTP